MRPEHPVSQMEGGGKRSPEVAHGILEVVLTISGFNLAAINGIS